MAGRADHTLLRARNARGIGGQRFGREQLVVRAREHQGRPAAVEQVAAVGPRGRGAHMGRIACGAVVAHHGLARGHQRRIGQAVGMEGIGHAGRHHLEVAPLGHGLERGQALLRGGLAVGERRRAQHGDALHPLGRLRQHGQRHIAAEREAGQPEALGQPRQMSGGNRLHRLQRRIVEGRGPHRRRQGGHDAVEHRTGVVQPRHQDQLRCHAGT